MLKIAWIGEFNPFAFLSCPLCGRQEFVSLSLAGVWCDYCNTKFSVRHTAGDPGCVVDASTEYAYGPVYECPACGYSKASLEESCECPSHKVPMIIKKGYMSALQLKPAPSYYFILKTGDYASGWLHSLPGDVSFEHWKEHPSCSDKDLDNKWAAFQRTMKSRKTENVSECEE